MLSNDSNQPQASKTSDSKAAGSTQIPVLDPNSPIEVASSGTGTGNDPVGTDNKPPGAYDGGDSLA
jgi:hypothetical protein